MHGEHAALMKGKSLGVMCHGFARVRVVIIKSLQKVCEDFQLMSNVREIVRNRNLERIFSFHLRCSQFWKSTMASFLSHVPCHLVPSMHEGRMTYSYAIALKVY